MPSARSVATTLHHSNTTLMLRLIANPTPKLLSDLSEETRTNTSLAKHTADDRGDLKFYKTSDGKKAYLRVCETVPPTGDTGPSTFKFSLYEVLPANAPAVQPTILDAK
jgi:hypothetical protein